MVSLSILSALSVAQVFFFTASALVLPRDPEPSASSAVTSLSKNPYLTFKQECISGTALGYPRESRDGGNGGNIAGKTVMTFSDTQWWAYDGDTDVSMTTNSYAYIKSTSAPTELLELGTDGTPAQAAFLTANETKEDYDLWPYDIGLTTRTWDGLGEEAYAIYNVALRAPEVIEYSTLVKYTTDASLDSPLTSTRVVQKWIDGTDKMWGNFGQASHNGDYMFLFHTGIDNCLELARIPWDRVDDTSQIEWYSNTTGWNKNPDDWTAVGLGHYGGGGTPFWLPYYHTWAVICTGEIDTFLISFSTTGYVYGPYSEQQVLLQMSSDPASNNPNYAPGVFPRFYSQDASSILLSYTYPLPHGYETRMAKIDFTGTSATKPEYSGPTCGGDSETVLDF
ncbi:hypothetical protein P7C71_g1550, partial [Lecanoromycetidae sp. Uapishka_2]